MRIPVFATNSDQTAMTVREPALALELDRNPAAAYLAKLSSGSRRTMAESLAGIARMLRPDLPADNQAACTGQEHGWLI